jgi:hypothetical protein
MFIFLCRFAPGGLTLRSAVLKKGKKAPGEKLPALTPVSRRRRVWKSFRLFGKEKLPACKSKDCSVPFAARVCHGGFVLWRIYSLQAVRSPFEFAMPALQACSESFQRS